MGCYRTRQWGSTCDIYGWHQRIPHAEANPWKHSWYDGKTMRTNSQDAISGENHQRTSLHTLATGEQRASTLLFRRVSVDAHFIGTVLGVWRKPCLIWGDQSSFIRTYKGEDLLNQRYRRYGVFHYVTFTSLADNVLSGKASIHECRLLFTIQLSYDTSTRSIKGTAGVANIYIRRL